MAVLEYDSTLFDSLPSFDAAQESLIHFESKLDRFGKVVSRHDGDDRVGLALLHRHFELRADEVLVEEVIPEQRISIGKPRPAVAAGAVTPHLFRATRDGDGYRWHPLEYVDVSEAPDMAESLAWFSRQSELLHEVAETLDREGALQSFGLSLRHGREEIPCADDEVLVESTDEASRTLTMRPRKLDGLQGTTTPTNWSVQDGKVVLRCTCQVDASTKKHVGHFETN
jgi:hypothetical protein